MEKQYFTKVEALEAMKERLEEVIGEYYCDLVHEVFNYDYYIDSNKRAEKALEEYGVFKAIGKVRGYELDNHGEFFTDISKPKELANMLWYIIGEDAFYDTLYEFFDEDVTEDNVQEAIQSIDKELEKLA